MANQRTTNGKRQREQNRKDRARAKQERLAARRAEPRTMRGPPIAAPSEQPSGDPSDPLVAETPLDDTTTD